MGNTLSTGAILIVLILIFGPISGAHFNPAVTLAFALRGEIGLGRAILYIGVQCCAAVIGVMLAHLMFDLPLLAHGVKLRDGAGQWIGEAVATFGLVLTILAVLMTRAAAVPYAVGLFIASGYWFTSSTSFANPAVTLARAFTDTFSGLRFVDVPAFVAAQIGGAVLATLIAALLWPRPPRE
jgi:glycerol uptake facilitator-like aquaporin